MHFSRNKPRNFRNILIDGVSILEMGANVLSIPDYIQPRRRVDTVQVPGRSGVLTYSDGSFEEVTYPIKIHVNGDAERVIHRITYGSELVMSTQPEYVYDYRIDGSVDLSRTLNRWHEGEIPFICHPFRRKRYERPQSPDAVRNAGNLPCCPSFRILGNGNITLTDNFGCELMINGVTQTVDIIGGEVQIVLVDNVPAGYKVVGDLPTIAPGEIATYDATGGLITEVKANWRWV